MPQVQLQSTPRLLPKGAGQAVCWGERCRHSAGGSWSGGRATWAVRGFPRCYEQRAGVSPAWRSAPAGTAASSGSAGKAGQAFRGRSLEAAAPCWRRFTCWRPCCHACRSSVFLREFFQKPFALFLSPGACSEMQCQRWLQTSLIIYHNLASALLAKKTGILTFWKHKKKEVR